MVACTILFSVKCNAVKLTFRVGMEIDAFIKGEKSWIPSSASSLRERFFPNRTPFIVSRVFFNFS